MALVLAAQAWNRGVKPRRTRHWRACSFRAEEARGADVIPRESWGIHLCRREARKDFNQGPCVCCIY